MSTRQYFIYTFILFAACLGSWFFLQALEMGSILQNQSDRPDAFMINANGVRMDNQGRPKDQLISPLMTHYSARGIVNISSPHFIIFNDSGEPWHITANHGQAQNGIQTLLLWDHVKLAQPAGPKNRAITMVTSELTIYPKQQYAETKQPVTVWQFGSIVNSIGMHADLKTGTVDLLSQARGEYQPES